MPTLNWIGKEAVVNHDKEVPFKLLRKVKSASVGENSQNLIMHGDNLEALKALMPFYVEKIKCIYIDPPYNTGNEKWVYNDKLNSPKVKKWIGKVVGNEKEDLSRHDKWLCMIYPRLKLLKDLLKEDGVIFISIDDNEHCNLKHAMDEIFGEENFVCNIIWQKKYSPQNDAKYFSNMHDFIVVYAKKKNTNGYIGGWTRNLMNRSEKQNARYKNLDDDPRGIWKPSDLSVKTYSASTDYPIKTPSGRIVNPPAGYCWRVTKEKFEEMVKDNRIWFGKEKSNVPSIKRFLSDVQQGIVPSTIWFREDVGDNQEASKEIKELFKDSDFPFETPKPVRLIKRIIEIASQNGDIFLDSFAGSGTTGHAVLDLNKEDGGNRKFILVEMEDKVAKDITAERVKRAIKKYDYKDGFEYCELDKPLFNEHGNIEGTCDFSQFATYIYFTETQTNIDKKKIKGNLVGEYNNVDYYLIYKGKNKNVLDKAFLKKIKKSENKKVIYADWCSIDDDILEKYNIEFKQIPYEVKVY
ncbi:MAG: site-specific DNA-methyltransferase [Candidatus Moranbacteria bacterium]|nr:site-specific DNA-methyltransferase [Candidatus Moranbacteria bacterium]